MSSKKRERPQLPDKLDITPVGERLKGEGARPRSMFSPGAPRFEPPEGGAATHPTHRMPKSAPKSAMGAIVAETAQVRRDALAEAREKVEILESELTHVRTSQEAQLRESGRLTFAWATDRIRPSRFYNREEAAFDDAEFKDLVISIQNNGQEDAIKVRRIDDPAFDFEIIKGHRRHRACTLLGKDVLCLLDTQQAAPSDDASTQRALEQRAQLENWRENEERQNLSPYEQARKLQCWLDEGLFDRQDALAEAINKSKTWVSRTLSLASIPDSVLAAFSDPRNISYKLGSLLASRLKEPGMPELITSEIAKGLSAKDGRLTDTEVLEHLLALRPRGRRPQAREPSNSAATRHDANPAPDNALCDPGGAVYARRGRDKRAEIIRFTAPAKAPDGNGFAEFVWSQLETLRAEWIARQGGTELCEGMPEDRSAQNDLHRKPGQEDAEK